MQLRACIDCNPLANLGLDQNVELEPLAPNGQQYGKQSNTNDILNECEAVRTAIANLTNGRLQELQQAQRAVLSDPDASSSSPASRELEKQSSLIMQEYRDLTARMKRIKSRPESGSPRNSAQVGSTSRALKTAMNQFQTIDGQFTKSLKEQMARQYRIVRPEASEQEVREAVEDTQSQQVFSQALLQGNRRGQAQSALNAVQSRHEAIQKIERQMIELAELFQDMENMVVQQEAAVTNIEMKGEEVVENMDNGTKQIDVAVKTARATRKKKWWCLGICGMLSFLLIQLDLTNSNKSSSSLLSSLSSFSGNSSSVQTQRNLRPRSVGFSHLPMSLLRFHLLRSHAQSPIPTLLHLKWQRLSSW